MRLVDNQNIIFDTKGNEVGYCVSADGNKQFFDLNGNIVESIEKLFRRE